MSKKKKKIIRPLRLIRGNLRKAGMPPGTVFYAGEAPAEPVRISLMEYDANLFREQSLSRIEEVLDYQATLGTSWINIDGISDVGLVEKIGKRFNLHPLVMEDIVVPGQRPKMEDYEDTLFIVVRMLRYDAGRSEILTEQISMILRQNCLITFQETVGDVFDQIRDRLRNNKGRARKMPADYLAYCLIDAIVDQYFSILDSYGEKIEKVEDDLLDRPDQQTLGRIHEFKRELTMLRKCIWPMRELAAAMQRSDNDLIQQSTKIYLRDVYDHTIQIIDTIESLRDVIASLLEVYLSSLNTRMNSVMKVLTLIATIFMPLSFLASVYGMNFKHMPELDSYWMYPVGFWSLIAVTVGAMLYYFKRQNWL